MDLNRLSTLQTTLQETQQALEEQKSTKDKLEKEVEHLNVA